MNPILLAVLIVSAIGLIAGLGLSIASKVFAVPVDEKAEKINDDTYVIAAEPVAEPVVEPAKPDNAVEHFVNQITNINDAVNTEYSESAVVVKHEVEQPVKKIPKKDEIQNYVMVGGVKKEKSEEEILATHNRGTNAFQNSADFLTRLKEANSSNDVANFKKAAEQTAAAKAAAAAPKTTTKKSTK
jgi:Xaa-Pro aminopeptidase